jgi:flagellar biosynthetic protein FlhB
MADQERNLPASQRKLDKAKSEGQVARSRDLGHFAAVAAGGAVLVALAPAASGWLKQMLASALRFNVATVQSPQAMGERLSELTAKLLFVVLPMGLVMMLVAVAVSAATGWVWTFKPIQPNFGKLNPISGIGRLFSKQQLIDALKASLLALILGGIGAAYLRANIDVFVSALGMPLPAAISHAASAIVGGMLLILLALALFAAIDLPLQLHLHKSRLKMSFQEMKQEMKEVEGNAEVKAKARARMREMANRRMMAAVPNADLVVMNPTHYAVALKYEEGSMGAPKIVAMGADMVAMKIRDLAKESKVPVLQAPVLARALYAHGALDREIPAALFSAVAQVLAYVYQLRAAMSGRVPMPGELPTLNIPNELDPHHPSAKKRLPGGPLDEEADE